MRAVTTMDFASVLAMLVGGSGLGAVDPDREYLQARGWFSLGREAGTGVEGWCNSKHAHRGEVLPLPEALRLQRAEDAAGRT